MNQIIIKIPNSMDSTIHANNIDEAIGKLQELKNSEEKKDFDVIKRFKGIAASKTELTDLDNDWYRQ